MKDINKVLIPTNIFTRISQNDIMTNIYYKELSYKVSGCLFEMFNKVGFGYQEKHYQRILTEIFKIKRIKFKREFLGKLFFNNKIIAKYFLDFLVEDKIIVELKVVNDFYNQHISQVLTYLKSHNLKLGILVLITKDGIKTKRIVN